MNEAGNRRRFAAARAIGVGLVVGGGLCGPAAAQVCGSVVPFGASQLPLTTGLLPQNIVTGDFDGDGVLDLAVPNVNSSTLLVRRGLGDGRFGLPQTLVLEGSPRNPVVADFDGDGRDDIAIPMFAPGNTGAHVYFGQPDGTLGGQVVLGTVNAPRTARAADFNGDGRPDLAIATLGQAGTTNVAVYLANPAGGFLPRQDVFDSLAAESLALGDVNGDGHIDMIVTHNASTVPHLHLGRCDGTFEPFVALAPIFGQTRHIEIADLNNDGYGDLVANSENDAAFGVAISNGDGTFQPWLITDMGVLGTARRGGVADLNNDGTPDLVFGHPSSGWVSFWPGLGNGSFGIPPTLTVPGGPGSIALADLDNDGDVDLIVACETSSDVRVYLNVCVPPPTFATQPQTVVVDRGGPAQFSVQVAGGSAGVGIQWYFENQVLSDGGPVSGAQSPTLTIDPAGFEQVGRYHAVIASPGGSATSDTAVLAVRNRCPPDVNGDSALDFFDILEFLGQFAAGCP